MPPRPETYLTDVPPPLPCAHGFGSGSELYQTTCASTCWKQRSRKAAHARVLPTSTLLRLPLAHWLSIVSRLSSCMGCNWSVLPRLAGSTFFAITCTIPFDACLCHQFRSHTYSPIDLKRLTTIYDSIVFQRGNLRPYGFYAYHVASFNSST